MDVEASPNFLDLAAAASSTDNGLRQTGPVDALSIWSWAKPMLQGLLQMPLECDVRANMADCMKDM
eukprot:15174127-Alexandrium_andersonii.AAC.1